MRLVHYTLGDMVAMVLWVIVIAIRTTSYQPVYRVLVRVSYAASHMVGGTALHWLKATAFLYGVEITRVNWVLVSFLEVVLHLPLFYLNHRIRRGH